MAVGINPKEGVADILTSIYKTNNLVIGWYVLPTAPTVNTVWADITQPAPSLGYEERTLLPSSWTVSLANGEVTRADEVWVATGNWATLPYGFYIRTIDATPIILHLQPSEIAPLTVLNTQTVTAQLSFSSV